MERDAFLGCARELGEVIGDRVTDVSEFPALERDAGDGRRVGLGNGPGLHLGVGGVVAPVLLEHQVPIADDDHAVGVVFTGIVGRRLKASEVQPEVGRVAFGPVGRWELGVGLTGARFDRGVALAFGLRVGSGVGAGGGGGRGGGGLRRRARGAVVGRAGVRRCLAAGLRTRSSLGVFTGARGLVRVGCRPLVLGGTPERQQRGGDPGLRSCARSHRSRCKQSRGRR